MPRRAVVIDSIESWRIALRVAMVRKIRPEYTRVNEGSFSPSPVLLHMLPKVLPHTDYFPTH